MSFFCETRVQNVSLPNGMRRLGVYHKIRCLSDLRAAYCCRVQDVIVGNSRWDAYRSGKYVNFFFLDSPLRNTSYRHLGKTYDRFPIMLHGGFVRFMRLLKRHECRTHALQFPHGPSKLVTGHSASDCHGDHTGREEYEVCPEIQQIFQTGRHHVIFFVAQSVQAPNRIAFFMQCSLTWRCLT